MKTTTKQSQTTGKTVVYDIEQLTNFHSLIAYNIKTRETNTFVIHSSRNDIKAYIAFLNQCSLMVGYNNIGYDYPMLHYILCNSDRLQMMKPDDINKDLYKESQRIISEGSFIYESKMLIRQLDLYRIHSFDNNARRTSLKALQFAMRYNNLQDMPIKHYEYVTDTQVNTILDYNMNDVMSTLAFLERSQDKIQTRSFLSEETGINLMNAGDIKIGTELFAVELAKAKGVHYSDIKQIKPDYNDLQIVVKDIILPYISFNIEPFKAVLDLFNDTVLTPDTIAGYFTDIPISKIKFKDKKGVYDYCNKNLINKKTGVLKNLNVIYDDCEYVFGAGGLHMSINPAIVESDEE